MTLYNFFTKPTKDPETIAALNAACEALRSKCLMVQVVQFKDQHTLMGQMLGENSTAGDSDLLCELWEFGYTWVNAHYPHEQATYQWDYKY